MNQTNITTKEKIREHVKRFCRTEEAADNLVSVVDQLVREARIDELERMHEKSFGWKRNKQLISGFVEDYYDRLRELGDSNE